jgi:hypothetical protein
MRSKMPLLLYCADRELLSATAFALRLHYDVTAVDDSRNAAAIMMASQLGCGILIHAKQGDFTGRLIHRLLQADLHVPLLLVDRAGDLAPVRYADMVLYGRNTTMAHILSAIQLLCNRQSGSKPRRTA